VTITRSHGLRLRVKNADSCLTIAGESTHMPIMSRRTRHLLPNLRHRLIEYEQWDLSRTITGWLYKGHHTFGSRSLVGLHPSHQTPLLLLVVSRVSFVGCTFYPSQTRQTCVLPLHPSFSRPPQLLLPLSLPLLLPPCQSWDGITTPTPRSASELRLRSSASAPTLVRSRSPLMVNFHFIT
jgi:hypothetical protein